MAETSTIFGFMKYVSATDILSDFKKTVDSHFVNSLKASISRSLKILVGRLTRFERARDGATIRCVNQLHHNRHVCLTLK